MSLKRDDSIGCWVKCTPLPFCLWSTSFRSKLGIFSAPYFTWITPIYELYERITNSNSRSHFHTWNWKPFLKTWKLLCSLREIFALLCHCLPPSVKIPLTSRSENPNSGQRPKLLGPQRNRKWPPIVMAGVWAANFGHLYPTLVPDDWRWRCFMRHIYLIAPFLDCPSKMSLWKQDSKDIGICPPFISFKYFHWSCTILVRRLPATRHCVKREPDAGISQCPGLLWEPCNTFPHSGEKPNKCNHCD